MLRCLWKSSPSSELTPHKCLLCSNIFDLHKPYELSNVLILSWVTKMKRLNDLSKFTQLESGGIRKTPNDREQTDG